MTDPIDAAILALVAACGAGRSIDPSEVARALAPAEPRDAWRRLMPHVRVRALALARAGRIEVLRKGRPVADLDAVKGVIRLRGAPTSAGRVGEA